MPKIKTKKSIERVYRYDEYSYANPNTRRGLRYFKQLLRAWPDWADDEAMWAIYEERDRINEEEGGNVVVDHAVPLNHPYVSGLHNEFNLQILTDLENSKKSNKYWPDMWEEQLELKLEVN
jgi:hypothetical protein